MAGAPKLFSAAEVARHNTAGDCWISIDGVVFDVTKFLRFHPGGRLPLLKEAGKDTSEQFWLFHTKEIFNKYMGRLAVGYVAGSKAAKAALHKHQNPEDPNKKVVMSEDTSRLYGDLIPYCDPSWYQKFNSPYYNDSHRKFRDFVRQFTETELMPNTAKWERDYCISRDALRTAGQRGILAACVGAIGGYDYVPELNHLRPDNFDYFHEFILIDEICRTGSGGVMWGLIEGLSIGLPPVINFGSDWLKKRVVRDCLLGEKVIALAISEPWAGSDVKGLRTTAKLSADGKHWIVNGSKKWITNGTFADYFTSVVRTGGPGELTMMLISRDMGGVTTRHMKCQGSWASGTAFVQFDDVKVPVEYQIGATGNGFKLSMFNFNHERWGFVIQALRFSRVCLEDSLMHAIKRKTFGKALMEHQAIRFKIADMARQIQALQALAETLTYQFNTLPHDRALKDLGDACALAKVQATKTLEFCAREGVHVFGGAGYVRSGVGERVERIYRDVRSLAIPGGAEEVLTDYAARSAYKEALRVIKARL